MENESKYEEWYFQSDYDLETAFDMFHSGRYVCNNISVPTRYPEDLRKLVSAYTKERTNNIIHKTKEIQSWIKQQ
jgi:hypothetical protein